MRLIQLAAIAAACLSLTALAQVYKWVDEKGVTHYGQTPPANAASHEVELRDPTGGPSPNAPAGPSVQEMENGFRQRQLERKEAEAKEASQRQSRCGDLRSRLNTLKSRARRIYNVEKQEYMSDEERNSRIAQLEADYGRYCR